MTPLVQLGIARSNAGGWNLILMVGGVGTVIEQQPTKAAILKGRARALKVFESDVGFRRKILDDIAAAIRSRP
jgi:hypothetical protein